MSQLLAAVRAAQAGSPFTPVTVLCGPKAVDDVTAALALGGTPLTGVEVQTLAMVVRQGARTLGTRPLERGDVAAEVGKLLREDAPRRTVFHDKGLHTSPATMEGLTDAVVALASFPPQWRDRHGGMPLPRAAAEIAHDVLATLSSEVFTFPQAVEAAAREDRAIVVAGEVAFDPVSQWALETIIAACGEERVWRVAPQAGAGEVSRATFVAEWDEAKWVASEVARAVEKHGAALHELAVGYCEDSQLPYLVRAFEEAGIPYAAPATDVWAQNPYFRGLAMLLRIDPEQMHRHDLAAFIATGVAEDAPWIVHFDEVSRGSEPQFYAGTDWDEARLGDSAARAAEVVSWVVGLREELQSAWSAPSWVEFAQRFGDLTAHRLRDARGEETVYRDEVVRTLARLQGPVSRGAAIDSIAPLYDRPQPVTTTGQVQIGPLETLAGRDLHTAFIVGAIDTALPGSLTPSATITPAQSQLTPEAFLRYRRAAFAAALGSARRVVITNPRSHQDGSGATQPSQWVSKRDLADFGVECGEPVEYPSLPALLADASITPLSEHDLSLIRTVAGDVDEHVGRYTDIMRYREDGAHGDQPGAEYNGFTGSDAGRAFLGKDISNSALEAFTRSPQFFFIERVLGSYALEDSVETMDVDARERGSLYHEIFERWTKEVLLAPDAPKEFDSAWWDTVAPGALETIVSEVIQARTSSRVNDAVWAGFSAGVRRDVTRWFARERADYAAGWRPLAAELAFGTNRREGTEFPSPFIDVPTATTGTGNTARMTFTGMIDRVDYRVGTDDDGVPATTLRITDYKTGQKYSDVNAGLKKSPTGDPAKRHYFQLALYGSLMHRRFVERDPLAADWFPQVAGVLEAQPPVRAVESRYWYFQAPEFESGIPSLTIDDAAITALHTNLANIYHYIAAGIFPPRELPSSLWVDDKEVRVGRTQYETVAETLTQLGLTPLDITRPFGQEDTEQQS